MLTAEQIRFESDENGWEMHVTTEDGRVHRFNVQDIAWTLYDHLQDTIGEWRQEGLSAALSGALSDEEDSGYDLDDPKHPTFHERYAG